MENKKREDVQEFEKAQAIPEEALSRVSGGGGPKAKGTIADEEYQNVPGKKKKKND